MTTLVPIARKAENNDSESTERPLMPRWLAIVFTLCVLSQLTACPYEDDGSSAGGPDPDPWQRLTGPVPLIDIATLLASSDYVGQPVRLQGRIVKRDEVGSAYYLDPVLGYEALQYCPAETLLFEDDSGALQFYIEEAFAGDEDYRRFIDGLAGKSLQITATWPDLSGMATCAAVCICDPKLRIAQQSDIVVLE